MQKKKLFLSTGVIFCITIPTTLALTTFSNSITIDKLKKNSYKEIYSNSSSYISYSNNLNSWGDTLAKFKGIIDETNKNIKNYENAITISKGMTPTKRYKFLKNAKTKVFSSKEEIIKLKGEIEHQKYKLKKNKEDLIQQEINKQQEKNKENIKSLTKNLRIINQGNIKNSTIIKEITNLEEAKLQLWKLEEYVNIILPETKNGTTIDEVVLTNGTNGNINVKLKLFTKYATNPIEEIHFIIKGQTDLEASKSSKLEKLETRQEKAERLTKEYNDQVDIYLKVKKDYENNTDESQNKKLNTILKRERDKLNKLRKEKNIAKAELRKTIFYPLVESLLDSAWIVDQKQRTTLEIANTINSLNSIDKKIDKMQEVFGVRFFKKINHLI
ncbi:MAG: hypothetical protein HRT98_02170 [Mycoplasmatales bacterium]|nr:hypothetical protein [Mycoplasmatales bacterium]